MWKLTVISVSNSFRGINSKRRKVKKTHENKAISVHTPYGDNILILSLFLFFFEYYYFIIIIVYMFAICGE